MKKIDKDGAEDLAFPDGTKVEVKVNGDRTLLLANGQKEIHTTEYKVTSFLATCLFYILLFSFQKREYPDGTVKILFNDGRQETRYSNGRIRVKDKSGALLHDSLDEGK